LFPGVDFGFRLSKPVVHRDYFVGCTQRTTTK
jgi:hypothetical protein